MFFFENNNIGVSWSIGGDGNVRTVITLPNILKEYNPNLKGFATGISPPLIPISSENLDVAVSGTILCFL